jgi:hypothetical protein
MRLRLFDFNPYDNRQEKHFMIQMFGITPGGQTVCVLVDDFKPHFFFSIPKDSKTSETSTSLLNLTNIDLFIDEIQEEAQGQRGRKLDNCFSWEIVKRKELHGFQNGQLNDFVYMEFDTMQTFNLFKNLWYDDEPDGSRVLKANGLDGSFLYESNIPPLLRFFHINKISPSGWIEIESYSRASLGLKKSSCSLEIKIPSSAIIPLPQCNDLAPFKICSFDIEASSSHGDFPVPVKSYKKLATNLVDHCSPPTKENIFHACMNAFFGGDSDKYQRVFPIEKVTEETVALYIDELFERVIVSETKSRTIESYFERQYLEEEKEIQETDAVSFATKSKGMKTNNKKINIIEILENMTEKREHKIIRLTSLLDIVFPKLQGDEVTFIGSTFVRFGEQTPYLENCIVLGTCDKREGIEINCQPTEKHVLL